MTDQPLDTSRLPQLATRSDTIVASVEWLFEPAWRGDRLLARVTDGAARLTDRLGAAVDDEHREAREVIGPSVAAEQAVLDGVWTAQPFVGDGSAARHWAETLAEEGLAGEVPDPVANETRRAFVVFDLIELDGELLHEVPYQERRRLLSSVVEENVRVRISPAVRLPIDPWLLAWRANGFTHYVAKHMNSRYHPGEVTEDWIEISAAHEHGPSIFGRMFGQRPKRRRFIGDR